MTPKRRGRVVLGKRKYITFTDEMTNDLDFLLKKKRAKRKKEGIKGQYHEKDLIAELLKNERTIKEVFN